MEHSFFEISTYRDDLASRQKLPNEEPKEKPVALQNRIPQLTTKSKQYQARTVLGWETTSGAGNVVLNYDPAKRVADVRYLFCSFRAY